MCPKFLWYVAEKCLSVAAIGQGLGLGLGLGRGLLQDHFPTVSPRKREGGGFLSWYWPEWLWWLVGDCVSEKVRAGGGL